jgi:hypothetical protein
MNELVTCLNTLEKGDGYYAKLPIKKDMLILSEKVKILISKERRYPTMTTMWLIYLVYQNKKLRAKFTNFVPHKIDSQCKSKEYMSLILRDINIPKLQKFFSTLDIETIILAYEKIKRNCFDCCNKFFIVFNGTKFNHSCDANVDYYFNDDTNILSFYANRDIESGEELTIQYINPLIAKSSLYNTYGFNCNCSLCRA